MVEEKPMERNIFSSSPRGIKRGALALSALLLSALLPVGGGSQVPPQQPLKRIDISYPGPVINFVPTFIALKRGYFREEGLDAKLLLLRGNLPAVAVIADSVPYATTTGSVLNAALKGAKLKILMVSSDKPDHDLITQPTIRSFGDLKGKVLGMSTAASVSDMVLREILKKNGLQPDRDAVIMAAGPTSVRLAALQSKALDGTVLSPPSNLRAMDLGYHRLAFSGDFMQMITGGFSTSDKRIKEEPQRLVKLVKANLKGLLFYHERRPEAIPMMMEFLAIKERAFAERLYEHSKGVFTRDGTITEELVVKLIDQIQRWDRSVSQPVKGSAIFDFSFVQRAKKELEEARWQP